MLKEEAAVYSIVATPQTEIDLQSDGGIVYSALALYREDGIVHSRFVYDISRNEEQAKRLLSHLKYIKPCKDELCEAISELI